MGTRALVRIYGEAEELLVTIYRQSDGYPEGLGRDLERVTPRVITDGLRPDPAGTANGMDCLAAQVIAKLKTGVGDVYLVPPGPADDYNAVYVYELRPHLEPRHLVEARSVDIRVTRYDRVLYGPLTGFNPFTIEKAE